MTDEHFRLGQYVRIGYRAWINQNGGPVGDKKSIDQLEADYRAAQPQANGGFPRPLAVSGRYQEPTLKAAPVPKARAKRANGRVE